MLRIGSGALCAVLLVGVSAALPGCHGPAAEGPAIAFPSAQPWTRTELLFGLTRRDKSLIMPWEWQGFVDRTITPEFPDGFTVIAGEGQYLDSGKALHKEPSRMVVLLYPQNQAAANEEKIRRIVTAYIRDFDQEAVLRTDWIGATSMIERQEQPAAGK